MKIPEIYDAIRPFEPEELPAVYDRLLADPGFRSVLAYLYPNVSVEAIGAVDHAVVGIYDTVNGRFQERAFDEPMEISALSGNVTRRDGQVHAHLHATLCDGEQRAFGGHAIELRISVTCEMFIRALPGEVGRRVDGDTGLTTFMFD